MTGVNAAAIAAGTKLSASAGGGNVKAVTDTITYDSQAVGSYNVGAKLPIGATVIDAFFVTSATTGSATIALGIAGATAKYIPAAAVTTANARTVSLAATGCLAETTTEEQLQVTVAAAALPASGTLDVVLLYVI